MRAAGAFIAGIIVGMLVLWMFYIPHGAEKVGGTHAMTRPAVESNATNPLLGNWTGPYEGCGMTFTPTTWSDYCAGTGSDHKRVSGYEISGSTITVSFPNSDDLDVYRLVDANTVKYDLLGTPGTLKRAKK
jgi:hypothetical protein